MGVRWVLVRRGAWDTSLLCQASIPLVLVGLGNHELVFWASADSLILALGSNRSSHFSSLLCSSLQSLFRGLRLCLCCMSHLLVYLLARHQP